MPDIVAPIKIMVFGRLAELTGQQELLLPPAEDTVMLVRQLEQQYPALTGVRYAIAVNRQVINGNVAISPEAVIALLPPFSGG